MKRITVTFSVIVDDAPEHNGVALPVENVVADLYDHICAWEFNTHGTVEFTDEQIQNDAVIPPVES